MAVTKTAGSQRPVVSTSVSRDGVTVQLRVYRDYSGTKWFLEVVHAGRTSTVWETPFDSIRDALDAFVETVSQCGMDSFVGEGDADTVH